MAYYVWLLKLGITMLIHNKDNIQFVTEFPCFLGHPVDSLCTQNRQELYSPRTHTSRGQSALQ